MKTILVLLSLIMISYQSQSNAQNPLIAAIGKKLEKKEFKTLAGMKCFQVTSIQVVSNKNDISFGLNKETQVVKNIDLRSGFLERDPFLENPFLGISTKMDYESCYNHLKNTSGVQDLPDFKEGSRRFAFYYQSEGSTDKFYISVNFKKDDLDEENVDSISIMKSVN